MQFSKAGVIFMNDFVSFLMSAPLTQKCHETCSSRFTETVYSNHNEYRLELQDLKQLFKNYFVIKPSINENPVVSGTGMFLQLEFILFTDTQVIVIFIFVILDTL